MTNLTKIALPHDTSSDKSQKWCNKVKTIFFTKRLHFQYITMHTMQYTVLLITDHLFTSLKQT